MQVERNPSGDIIIETDAIKLLLQPGNGGKIKSLISRVTGREFLWQDPRPDFSNEDYVSHDISGYDECLPTIADCKYPDEPFRGRQLGDHGSVWNQPWETKIDGDRVVGSATASTLPMRLVRTLSFPEPHRLRLNYNITNASDATLKFVWSAHPCLNVESASQIVLPEAIKEMRVYFGDPLLVENGKIAWPVAKLKTGEALRLDTGFEVTRGFHTKLFATFEEEGWCELRHPDGESLRLEAPGSKIPYCGLWINQGGLVLDESNPTCIVALEPCTGLNDELPLAEGLGSVSALKAGESLVFDLLIEIRVEA